MANRQRQKANDENRGRYALPFALDAHQETSLLCGAVSTVDPARDTKLRASLAGWPNASSTQMARVAVRPTPPAQ